MGKDGLALEAGFGEIRADDYGRSLLWEEMYKWEISKTFKDEFDGSHLISTAQKTLS